MWASIVILMLIAGGRDVFSFNHVMKTVLSNVLLTFILLPAVCFTWWIIIKKVTIAFIAVLFWNLTMWMIITCICQLSFGILSGNVHGLSSFRNAWLLLLGLSTVFTTFCYYYVNSRNIKINQ